MPGRPVAEVFRRELDFDVVRHAQCSVQRIKGVAVLDLQGEMVQSDNILALEGCCRRQVTGLPLCNHDEFVG